MSDFHFLDPFWFLALIPLIAGLVFFHVKKQKQSTWNQVIQPHLLQHLLVSTPSHASKRAIWLTMAGLLIIVFSLANPVWNKKPQPVFETASARVIVLDLSASMNAADLKPDRMTRARLKLQDILQRQTEGQTGLVVFAGDAFSVTPLSRDNDTILSQIRVLEPAIMPVQGSQLGLGLLKAAELLKLSGIPAGDILVIADGYSSPTVFDIAKQLSEQGHRISVLGIGTIEGAPISNGQGDVMRNSDNIPILARLPEDRFKRLSEIGNGYYSPLTLDNSDIDYLLSLPPLSLEKELPQQLMQQNQWKENGPYLALLLLPLAALAFRKGWIMVIVICTLSVPLPTPVQAFEWDKLSWEDLWLTREQQASKALQAEQHQQALELSNNPAIKGSALYKQQFYQQALNEFQQLNTSDSHYNRGNTLAKLEQYQQAIEAYEEALKLEPDMRDAIENKKAVEDLLKQQSQQQNQQEDQQQDQASEQNSDDSENQSEQNNAEQQPNQADNNQQSNQSDNSDQNNQSSQQNNQSESQQNNQTESDQAQSSDLDEQAANADESQQNIDKAETDENNPEEKPDLSAEQLEAQPFTDEEEQAAQQWLRRIPDDPGGLLKRKFLYQYQNRQRQPSTMQPW